MLCRNLFLRSCSTYHLPVRGLESHPFDHDKYSDRNPAIKPDKLRITIPVPVQSRALKRSVVEKQILGQSIYGSVIEDQKSQA